MNASGRVLRATGAAAAVVALAVNLVWGARIYSRETPPADRDDAYEKIALYTKVLEQVRKHYVDEDRTAFSGLTYGALHGVMRSLDEHCEFMDPESFKAMQEDTSGKFGGIGVVVGMRDGILTVIAPMEDTPGYRAGLQAGDRLVEIDGKTTEDMELPDAVKLMRGPPGSRVRMKYIRAGSTEVRSAEIERAVIDVASVKDAHMLDGGVGYLRLVQFDERTVTALDESLKKLEGQGARALVMDLRNNPGGLLQSAVEVCSRFLPRGSMVVYTQGRDVRERQTFYARDGGRPRTWPMVILVNEGSASAAEIVSGALQDHKRAVLVGERTFGKGSVQTILPLDDGSAIRLTTAKYYTPGKRVIHDYGIEPDILIPMPPEDWTALIRERMEASAPGGPPKAGGNGPARASKDAQLDRAVDVLKGIMLYKAESDRRTPPAG